MAQCVLDSVKAYISGVASLEKLLSSIDEEQINREEVAKFKAQIADNEVKLEEVRQFKATLYENYIDNLISKKDYRDLKAYYTEQAERMQEAIGLLREEMERTINSASDRLRWTQHFKAFSTMTTLDRRAVIAMVHSIEVMGKNDLEITFRYQMEFRQALERLEQRGQLTPPLLVVLTMLQAQKKEAA